MEQKSLLNTQVRHCLEHGEKADVAVVQDTFGTKAFGTAVPDECGLVSDTAPISQCDNLANRWLISSSCATD